MSEFKFKKRTVSSNIRRRDDEDNVQGKFDRHTATEPVGEDEGGVRGEVAVPKLVGVLGGSTVQREEASEASVQVRYESNRDAALVEQPGGATHTSEIDTAIDRDGRAILERTLQSRAEGSAGGGLSSRLYKGQAAYETTFVKTDVATAVGASKVTGTQGPLRAPSFVRTTTRFDYQPDICKDYKETGFCGYGDSCKFLHDRGDFKAGWQQEKEWDEQQAKKKKRLEEARAAITEDDLEALDPTAASDVKKNVEDDIAEGNLPFACLLCREAFKNPVITMCGHYFCAECILKANKTSTKCPATACGKQMFGVFNKANKIVKRSAADVSTKSGSQPSAADNKRGSWGDV